MTVALTGVFVAMLLVLALPTLLSCAYLLVVTLLSRRVRPPPCPAPRLRFDVIVPAHDEAAVVGRCVASLRRMDWPAHRFRVVVVADNCSDATAEISRKAGARVIERCDPSRRGKGYALHYGFETSLAERWAQAVVVIDADSEVSANFLEALAARIGQGAHAVQARYGVQNPRISWRTRLMAIAHAAFHVIRSRARERLRLSCGIRGNGWCVTHALLRRVPYQAYSLTEDIEFGIDLGLAGYRVTYADEASVLGEMVTSGRIAQGQRRRWEDGRFALLRTRTPELLRAAVDRGSAVCADLALDLLIFPLSYLVLAVIALALLAMLAGWWSPQLWRWLWLAAACGGALLLYVLRAWQLSNVGARGLLDLACAPAFIGWKLVVMLRRHESRHWVRTERERP